MKKVSIGDFVETIHGVNGILIEVRNTYRCSVAYIATADGRIFYCPVTDLKNCRFTGV